METLQRDVLVGAVFSANLFRNFSSHVNVRRDIFVLILLPEHRPVGLPEHPIQRVGPNCCPLS